MAKGNKIAAASVAAMLLLSVQPARADMEVLESTVPELKSGSTLTDNTRLKIPKDGVLRLLVNGPSGSVTKTLKGPYEGTAANYKDRRRWVDRLTGKGKEVDPPMAASKSLKREK